MMSPPFPVNIAKSGLVILRNPANKQKTNKHPAQQNKNTTSLAERKSLKKARLL